MNRFYIFFILGASLFPAQNFTKADTLKGSDTQFRNFWDVKKYEITVEADFKQKSVSGSNLILFEITKDVKNPVFQIDLQQPMQFKLENSTLTDTEINRDGDFIFIKSKRHLKKGEKHSFTIQYSGTPKIAKNAPWDGGWVFDKDSRGNPFISVAQEGEGVSLWLPTKNIWSDEPDLGIKMSITTPKDLVGVGNGRLISKEVKNGKNIFVWEVKNAINPYNIVPNIAKYINFKDIYNGEKGQLNLDYWVLEENLEKAKKHFTQVKPMLEAMEYWFGPYPFYEDSYKLVESPYLGMEHQSNIAYGNQYKNGYLGMDMSMTGKGMGWDYIIVHESGHEWFANNITAKDQADMWIHESFTTYSEGLFVEKFLDRKSADIYIRGLRLNIANDTPIMGQFGVRNEGSGDMYAKGANMLHTIRTIINDDTKFREILRGINRDFSQQTITGKQIIDYFNQKSGMDLTSVFAQYLESSSVPTLEYNQDGNNLTFQFVGVNTNLKFPVRINNSQIIYPTTQIQTVKLENNGPVEFDYNYYMKFVKTKN